MKPLVGALRTTFAGEHPCWIFRFPLEGINACCIRKFPRNIFPQQPLDQVAPTFISWQCDFRNACLSQRRRVGLHAYLFARSEEHTSELQSRENLVCRL